MKKIIIILLVLVCVFSLCSLTLGTTIDGLFTGINNSASADDYGQFMDSFGVVLNWFNGLGTFLRSALDFIRNVGISFANAWESVEVWIANTGADLMAMLENIFKFFGWVNNENPNPETPETPETRETPETSALRCATFKERCASQRAERILNYVA